MKSKSKSGPINNKSSVIRRGSTNWVHLAMFSLIALLAGGWLTYYINDTNEIDVAPHYYLYKVVRDETSLTAPLNNPETGYGKITITGKITGNDAMSASLNNFLQIDGQYWDKYAGKFVEATGYLSELDGRDAHNMPLRLEVEGINLDPRNNINDSGVACKTSSECRYQCVIGEDEYKKQCPEFDKNKTGTYCSNATGECSQANMSQEENSKYVILNGENSW